MKRQIKLGLLLSRSGSYSLISEACRSGALAAIARVNGDQDMDLSFVPVERDPCGNIDAYGPLCEEILRDTGARHVVGCITSWSRKEVIPTVEKFGGTLWYAVPYEGFVLGPDSTDELSLLIMDAFGNNDQAASFRFVGLFPLEDFLI
jgi:hypothetical protein